MSYPRRSAVLQEIGAELQAGVVAYVTGDRENLETEVGTDVLRRIPRHLEAVGKQDRLALVLYTIGGDTNTPWPFVNFLRGYCEELFVLVPFWAHSAGTLIALGADKIYLTRFGTLGPIDPTVTNEFNPLDPATDDKTPIAVEDVLAFFELASEQDVGDTGLGADAFRQLAESVHPLALGNVKRTIEQISLLAKKLVRLHSPDADEADLTTLVRQMTTELYCHSHMITRAEASAFGLPVEQPSEDLEDRLLAYYDHLKADLELLERFDPGMTLQASRQPPDASPSTRAPTSVPDPVQVVLERAYVETPTTCDAFVTRGVISRLPDTQPSDASLEVTSERWETIA